MSYYNIYQDVLFYISCVGLVCCGIMILLVGALPTIWDTFTTAIGKNRTTQLIMLCFAVGAIMYGGTKNDGPTGVSKFIFDKYLLDNGSYSTNDTIVIKWKQAISNALPDDTPVYIEYKEAGSTNEWQSLASSSQNLGNYEWQGTLAGATNYNYNIWCYYVPPAPVHTNGIWTYNTLKDKQNKYILPLRAEVRDGGEVIATPKSKWDYEANDEAYWFKHYAPNTAIRIDLTLPNVKSNEITINPTGDGTDAVTTIDWGDGETTSVALGKSLQTIKHTYASRKEYVIVISDTVSSPCRYGDVNYTDRYFVDSLLRWGDNVTSAENAFRGCENFRRTARWNAKITNANWTYCDCHNFLGPFYQFNDVTVDCTWTYVRCYVAEGTIPPWGKAVRCGNSTYFSCRKATGIIPPWGESMTDSHYTYYDCQSLSGAWTDDPDELMPSRFTYVVNCVTAASDALRALFYEDWGGTKKRPTTTDE